MIARTVNQPRPARLSPDGYVAQRMDKSINGHGHWLLTYADETNDQIALRVFSDEQVCDWPLLSPNMTAWDDFACLWRCCNWSPWCLLDTINHRQQRWTGILNQWVCDKHDAIITGPPK